MNHFLRIATIAAAGGLIGAAIIVAFPSHDSPSKGDKQDSLPELGDRIAQIDLTLDKLAARVEQLEKSNKELPNGSATLSQRAAPLAPNSGTLSERERANYAVVMADLASLLDDTPAAVKQRNVERLAREGFYPEKIEWILNRTEELRLDAVREQHDDARRSGTPQTVGSGTLADQTDYVNRKLRFEIGDAEYERYRRAMYLTTEVRVREVMQGSFAEGAVLLPGDEIVSYDGRRVFEMSELVEMASQGTQGQPVVVEVIRTGLVTQLVVARGPLAFTESPMTASDFVARQAKHLRN